MLCGLLLELKDAGYAWTILTTLSQGRVPNVLDLAFASRYQGNCTRNVPDSSPCKTGTILSIILASYPGLPITRENKRGIIHCTHLTQSASPTISRGKLQNNVKLSKPGVTNCRIKKGVTNCRIEKNGGTPIIRKSLEIPRIEPLSTLSGTCKLMYHGPKLYPPV